jgi:hypothetical protein
VIAGGILMGLSLAGQIMISLYELWGASDPAPEAQREAIP